MEYRFPIIVVIILIIWVPWLYRYHIAPRRSRRALNAHFPRCSKRYQRIKRAEHYFNKLYQGVIARDVSIRERRRRKISDDCFTYGEIEFLSFAYLLELTDPKPGDNFYDLGCGAGKAVISAALLYDFSKVVGVEFLDDLHHLSKDIVAKFHRLIGVGADPQTYNIEFRHADMLATNFSDIDILFLNSTCFMGNLWEGLLIRMRHLKKGARVIVTSREILSDDFILEHKEMLDMSWGLCSASIYRKIN